MMRKIITSDRALLISGACIALIISFFVIKYKGNGSDISPTFIIEVTGEDFTIQGRRMTIEEIEDLIMKSKGSTVISPPQVKDLVSSGISTPIGLKCSGTFQNLEIILKTCARLRCFQLYISQNGNQWEQFPIPFSCSNLVFYFDGHFVISEKSYDCAVELNSFSAESIPKSVPRVKIIVGSQDKIEDYLRVISTIKNLGKQWYIEYVPSS